MENLKNSCCSMSVLSFVYLDIIYDLCIKVESNRDYGIVYVDYNAHNLFSINQADIKIP
jgi:hypothetical protein